MSQDLYDPMLPPIDYFTGDAAFLSNFFPAVLVYEGIQYANSEAAFNAAKSEDPAIRRWIAEAPTPHEAKRRGNDQTRTILRPGWDETVRYQAMADVLRAKFTCHPARIEALLGTGNRLLIEGNRHHDTHWGRCICSQHKRQGENHLGRLLMELRAELRAA